MGVRERGAAVRRVIKKMELDPAAIPFEHSGLRLYIVRDFLNNSECNHLEKLILEKNEPSGTLGDDYPLYSDFRTSSTSHLPGSDNIVREIDERISGILGLCNTTAESTQGQLYRVGETFKPHFDFFHIGHRHWKQASREGGQRVWTAMVYLNDNFEGGETRFTKANFAIHPKAGTMIVWNNMASDGQPNLLSIHEGAPVAKGEKMIITRWYRERTWKMSARPPKIQNN